LQKRRRWFASPKALRLGRVAAWSAAALAWTLLAAGCVSQRGYRQAQVAEEFGRWDEAVLHYLELVEQHPDRLPYRNGLLRAKIRASQEHFKRAKEYHDVGALEPALVEYRQSVQLDPTNQYAQVEYEKLRDEMQRRKRVGSGATIEEMKRRNNGKRPQPPVLDPQSDEPITLAFPKPVSVFDIYRALGKGFGINILFDPKLRDQKLPIELNDVDAQSALEILMRTANHFYKVLDETSIIVAEDNPQNRRNYEDLVIQTFFLSNAEVKDVMTMLRSLVGAKNIASNDQLNAIVLRDTADKVKVAERIILTNDKSRGEVVIDVELVQINTQKLQELGVSLSEYGVTQSLDPNPIRLSDVEFLNQANWILNLPAVVYDFVKNSTDAQLLANPQLRISDGEHATLHIGDREPIPVTTFNSSQTVGGNIVPITSFQYQDVGIRLELEPRIHHNQEISLQLTVEVSQISGFREASGGQQQPVIGTREIESTIRLKDGETNFLAGLIQTDEQNGEAGVPGLSDIPVLGRLFSRRRTQRQRTDLVLTLTPHIVRTPDITEEDLLPIWVGTEANITFRGGSPRVESDVDGPFDEEQQEEGAERIREMIRRRIQNLPRGLRDSGDEEESGPPAGVDLAPGGAPSDLFRRPDPDDDDDGQPFSLIYLPEEAAGSDPAGSDPAGPDPAGPDPAGPDPAGPDPAAADADAPVGRELGPGQGTRQAAADESDSEAVEAKPGDKETPTRSESQGAGQAKDAAVVTVRLLPKAVKPEVGQTFELELQAEAKLAVAHLPLTILWEPEILAVEEVVPGDFFGDEEAQFLSDFTTPGRLVIGASVLGRSKGVKGVGTLATITFKALAEGRARMRFENSEALNRNLRRRTPFETEKANIKVEPASGDDGSGGTSSAEDSADGANTGMGPRQ
jgi:general secretion pathway protein D